MKITDEYLKIQAYLDGELSLSDARYVESRIESEPLLKDLYEELRFASELFVPENESPREVPLPRNAYWAGIQNAIETVPQAPVSRGGFDWKPLLQKLRIPAVGIAALLVLSIFVSRDSISTPDIGTTASYMGYVSEVGPVDEVVSAPNASTISYYAEEQEMSVTFIHCEKAFMP